MSTSTDQCPMITRVYQYTNILSPGFWKLLNAGKGAVFRVVIKTGEKGWPKPRGPKSKIDHFHLKLTFTRHFFFIFVYNLYSSVAAVVPAYTLNVHDGYRPIWMYITHQCTINDLKPDRLWSDVPYMGPKTLWCHSDTSLCITISVSCYFYKNVTSSRHFL